MSRSQRVIWVVGMLGWTTTAGVRPGAAQTVECATTSTVEVPACVEGLCDNPVVRNGWDPAGPGATPMVVRVKFNVMVAAMLPGDLDNQIQKIRDDFVDYNIKFQVVQEYFGSNPYESPLTECAAEAMKDFANDNPDQQLNVYVTHLSELSELNFLGRATLPWEVEATTAQGGIILDVEAMSFGNVVKTVLTHEIGHALGLWHTHHGTNPTELCCHVPKPGCPVGQIPACNPTCRRSADSSFDRCAHPCYEEADEFDCNTTGDFCCDTPATPFNFGCTDALGVDPCTGRSWGACTQEQQQEDKCPPRNFMSAAEDLGPNPCRNHYTFQQ